MEWGETMEDLISREKALKALEQANVRLKGMRFGKIILAEYAKQVREGYIDVINDIPSEDAEMKRFGQWVDVGKTSKGTPIRQCDYCGVEKAGRPKSAYCPDCGARMSKTIDEILGQEQFEI